jgi:hypothetical protein
MRTISTICILITTFLLAACTKDAVPVELSKVCAADNEKKYISTSGFLDDKGGVFCSSIGGRMDCGFAVLPAPGGDKVFSADIEQGSGSNEVEKLDRGYKKEDIKIRDNTGAILTPSDRVNLTGEMSIAPAAPGGVGVCFMKVDKIEK